MTKQEWLHICRLNQEWYFLQCVYDGKPLSEDDKRWIYEHMPSDDTFDDGRIEFFQENFKPEIDEDKLDELAKNYADRVVPLAKGGKAWTTAYLSYKIGYREAKEE